MERKQPLRRKTPLKRKTSLRRESKKAREQRDRIAPVRVAYKSLVGRCERCFQPGNAASLDLHEIPAGAHRHRAAGQPLCWLVLCRKCHEEVQGIDYAEQLAIRTESSRRALNEAIGREAV